MHSACLDVILMLIVESIESSLGIVLFANPLKAERSEWLYH